MGLSVFSQVVAVGPFFLHSIPQACLPANGLYILFNQEMGNYGPWAKSSSFIGRQQDPFMYCLWLLLQ